MNHDEPKTDLEKDVIALLDDWLSAVSVAYFVRLDELFGQYKEAFYSEEKRDLAKKIAQISRAYELLEKNHDVCKQRISNNIQECCDRSYEFYKAKLDGKPHDWDF